MLIGRKGTCLKINASLHELRETQPPSHCENDEWDASKDVGGLPGSWHDDLGCFNQWSHDVDDAIEYYLKGNASDESA